MVRGCYARVYPRPVLLGKPTWLPAPQLLNRPSPPPPQETPVPIDHPRQGANWPPLASLCCSAGSLFPRTQLLTSKLRREAERKRAAQVRLPGGASRGAHPGAREWEASPASEKRPACLLLPGSAPYTPLSTSPPRPVPSPGSPSPRGSGFLSRSVPPPPQLPLPPAPAFRYLGSLPASGSAQYSARKRRGGQLRAMAEPSRTADPVPRGQQ